MPALLTAGVISHHLTLMSTIRYKTHGLVVMDSVHVDQLWILNYGLGTGSTDSLSLCE